MCRVEEPLQDTGHVGEGRDAFSRQREVTWFARSAGQKTGRQLSSPSIVKRPSPEQQVRFFTNLQLLLSEGEFVSTYKYALLLALMRWAIENPGYDEAVPLDVVALAPHFVQLYWPHIRPFEMEGALRSVAESRPAYGSSPDDLWRGVLVQDRGRQLPRVLKLIMEEHQRGCGRFDDVPEPRRSRLLTEVRNSIKTMPLWKLQTIGGAPDLRFLYHRGDGDQRICFEPGIVVCLAGFAPLIEHVVRSAWLRFVLRCNSRLLGSASQVEDFLFPGSRASLGVWLAVVEDVQGDQCFYCAGQLKGDVEVDHFLPWTRYPRDLGHNFVLAHAGCNLRKKDHLASCEHLESWCSRNEQHGERMAERFAERGLPHDWPTLRRVACSLYNVAANANASVWRAGSELVPLDADWRRILGCA